MKVTEKNSRIGAINRDSAWEGYTSPYVQNIIKSGSKVLKLLAVLTFDPELLFWTHGLQKHMEKRMREARAESDRIEKAKFNRVKDYG